MTKRQSLPESQIWIAAGIGSALLAGHLMLESMSRLHRAGRPARLLLGAAPFVIAGWMLSQIAARAPREIAEPAPAPRRKRVVDATDAEVVRPAKPRLVAPAAAPVPELVPEPDPVPDPAPDFGAAVEAVMEPEAVETAPEPAPAFVEDRPTALAAARDDGPDDLTRIKGVGPKLGASLGALGYFHFDQLAAWSAEEASLVDESLGGIPGRIARQDWVGQARMLAGVKEAPDGPRRKVE